MILHSFIHTVFDPVRVYTEQHSSRGILHEMFVPFHRNFIKLDALDI